MWCFVNLPFIYKSLVSYYNNARAANLISRAATITTTATTAGVSAGIAALRLAWSRLSVI
jgi:hypothetical protein